MAVFLICFGMIFIAELGDKTQLMVFSLALRYGGGPVLAGAVLAFALLSGSAALFGNGLAGVLPRDAVTRISAWIFIIFGGCMLVKKDEEADGREEPSLRAGLLATFGMIAVSEMGDKTQVAVLLLSVKYQSFYSVFLGSLAGLSLASLIGVLAAGSLHKSIPFGYIRPISGVLFMLIGLGTLLLAYLP